METFRLPEDQSVELTRKTNHVKVSETDEPNFASDTSVPRRRHNKSHSLTKFDSHGIHNELPPVSRRMSFGQLDAYDNAGRMIDPMQNSSNDNNNDRHADRTSQIAIPSSPAGRSKPLTSHCTPSPRQTKKSMLLTERKFSFTETHREYNTKRSKQQQQQLPSSLISSPLGRKGKTSRALPNLVSPAGATSMKLPVATVTRKQQHQEELRFRRQQKQKELQKHMYALSSTQPRIPYSPTLQWQPPKRLHGAPYDTSNNQDVEKYIMDFKSMTPFSEVAASAHVGISRISPQRTASFPQPDYASLGPEIATPPRPAMKAHVHDDHTVSDISDISDPDRSVEHDNDVLSLMEVWRDIEVNAKAEKYNKIHYYKSTKSRKYDRINSEDKQHELKQPKPRMNRSYSDPFEYVPSVKNDPRPLVSGVLQILREKRDVKMNQLITTIARARSNESLEAEPEWKRCEKKTCLQTALSFEIQDSMKTECAANIVGSVDNLTTTDVMNDDAISQSTHLSTDSILVKDHRESVTEGLSQRNISHYSNEVSVLSMSNQFDDEANVDGCAMLVMDDMPMVAVTVDDGSNQNYEQDSTISLLPPESIISSQSENLTTAMKEDEAKCAVFVANKDLDVELDRNDDLSDLNENSPMAAVAVVDTVSERSVNDINIGSCSPQAISLFQDTKITSSTGQENARYEIANNSFVVEEKDAPVNVKANDVIPVVDDSRMTVIPVDNTAPLLEDRILSLFSPDSILSSQIRNDAAGTEQEVAYQDLHVKLESDNDLMTPVEAVDAIHEQKLLSLISSDMKSDTEDDEGTRSVKKNYEDISADSECSKDLTILADDLPIYAVSVDDVLTGPRLDSSKIAFYLLQDDQQPILSVKNNFVSDESEQSSHYVSSFDQAVHAEPDWSDPLNVIESDISNLKPSDVFQGQEKINTGSSSARNDHRIPLKPRVEATDAYARLDTACNNSVEVTQDNVAVFDLTADKVTAAQLKSKSFQYVSQPEEGCISQITESTQHNTTIEKLDEIGLSIVKTIDAFHEENQTVGLKVMPGDALMSERIIDGAPRSSNMSNINFCSLNDQTLRKVDDGSRGVVTGEDAHVHRACNNDLLIMEDAASKHEIMAAVPGVELKDNSFDEKLMAKLNQINEDYLLDVTAGNRDPRSSETDPSEYLIHSAYHDNVLIRNSSVSKRKTGWKWICRRLKRKNAKGCQSLVENSKSHYIEI